MAYSKVPSYQTYPTQKPADSIPGRQSFTDELRVEGPGGTFYVYGIEATEDITEAGATEFDGADTVDKAAVLAAVQTLQAAVLELQDLLGKEL